MAGFTLIKLGFFLLGLILGRIYYKFIVFAVDRTSLGKYPIDFEIDFNDNYNTSHGGKTWKRNKFIGWRMFWFLFPITLFFFGLCVPFLSNNLFGSCQFACPADYNYVFVGFSGYVGIRYLLNILQRRFKITRCGCDVDGTPLYSWYRYCSWCYGEILYKKNLELKMDESYNQMVRNDRIKRESNK